MRVLIKWFLVLTLPVSLAAQSAPFGILIEPMEIPGLGGLQSYAWGQHNGRWLIVGGRTEGLHWPQPFASFSAAGNNRNLIVVDPATAQVWLSPLSSLDTSYQDQLSSTNLQFHQEGDRLYLVGGYGYGMSADDPYTYDYLTVVDVPAVMDAVIRGTPYAHHFRQVSDPRLAVTGGQLRKIGDTWYLVGGHRFDGRYNPMGPTHGPGFSQQYTNAIRRFRLNEDRTHLSLAFLPEWLDSAHLHRRDYNVVPQVMPDGTLGYTAFSGVFQKSVDWPYLNCVSFDSSGYEANASFSQHYNHYHCAVLPMYSASARQMHTVFFGGIAQYYDEDGMMVQDNDVPFVPTIARVTRDDHGLMTEHKLPIVMPSLLGAGAELIPLEGLPQYPNGVLKLDSLMADTTQVGFIYGGISSSAPNIFFVNDGTQSSASAQLFRVKVIRGAGLGADDFNEASTGTLHLQVDPNPTDATFYTRFELSQKAEVKIRISKASGKVLETKTLSLEPGVHRFRKRYRPLSRGGVYLITLDAGYESCTRKIVVNP